MKVLVVFASNHGHTARIAAHLAAAIREAALDVHVFDVKQGATPSPAGYDGVVVAGSLHGGSHQRELSSWVKKHRAALGPISSLFLSVSLSASEDAEEAREATGRCIREFVEETGWSPGRAEPIAGALQYREYGLPTKLLMRWMMYRGGHPTDASQDYDYTDWGAVTELGREFAAGLGPSQSKEERT